MESVEEKKLRASKEAELRMQMERSKKSSEREETLVNVAATSSVMEPSAPTPLKKAKGKEYEMPNHYKKKVGNPTYMAESYDYLAEKASKVNKNFDKKSIFKQRKKGDAGSEESGSQQS